MTVEGGPIAWPKGSPSYLEEKERGILIISIQDLYKDIDRRQLYLIWKNADPYPNGYFKASKQQLHEFSLGDLHKVKAHYKEMQAKMMELQCEVRQGYKPWYWETSKVEWEVREFGRNVVSAIGKKLAWFRR